MQTDNTHHNDHPLRNLTAAQFMALGGNAVVYVRHVQGDQIESMLPEGEFSAEDEFHIAVGADGAPLMVADSEEALADWLEGRNLGVVTVH